MKSKISDQQKHLTIKWRELSSENCYSVYENCIKEFEENKEESIDFLTILKVQEEVTTFLEESLICKRKYELLYPKLISFFSDQFKQVFLKHKNDYELELNSVKAEKVSLQNILQNTKKQIEDIKLNYEKQISQIKEEQQDMRLQFEQRIDEKNRLIKSIQQSNENTIEDLKGNIEQLQNQIEKKNKDISFQSKLKSGGGGSSGSGGGGYHNDYIVEGIMTRLDLFKDNLLKSEIEKARMNMKQEISYRIEDMQEEFQKKISSLRKEMEKIVLTVKAESRKDQEELRSIIKVYFFN